MPRMKKFLMIMISTFWIGWRVLSTRAVIPCPSWLGKLVEKENPLASACKAKNVLEFLGDLEGKTLVDVGCGPGRITLPAAEKAGRVIALDLQKGMLDQVKKRATSFDNIEYIQSPVNSSRLPESSADFVILSAVLGEIPEQQIALQIIYKILKPGGTLSVSELIFDPHFQRKGHVIKLAKACGFKVGPEIGKPWAYTLHLIKPLDSNASVIR